MGRLSRLSIRRCNAYISTTISIFYRKRKTKYFVFLIDKTFYSLFKNMIFTFRIVITIKPLYTICQYNMDIYNEILFNKPICKNKI